MRELAQLVTLREIGNGREVTDKREIVWEWERELTVQ